MGIFDRFPYSSTHEMNLDFMLGKATEIAEDMQTVTAGMAQVQAGLEAISEKTEQATQAAAQAAASASSIEGSVTAAEEAAEEAQMHNESAQTWANNAMTYKADCQRAATEAAASSSSAAQAATAAAASEDTVATYAQAANASAQSAANNNDSAHQYANQASASASNATFHSSNAQTAATNAQTAATNANTSATNASASADRAAFLKTDVETLHRMCVAAVDQAATEAVNAANSAAQAAATKTDVETLVESLPEDFTDLNNTVNQLSDEIGNLQQDNLAFAVKHASLNLFDYTDENMVKTGGWYYSTTLGSTIAFSSNQYTEGYAAIKIPAEGIEKLTIAFVPNYTSGNKIFWIGCVDEDMKLLKYEQPADPVPTTSELAEGTKYVLISWALGNDSFNRLANIVIVSGEGPITEYIPYFEPYYVLENCITQAEQENETRYNTILGEESNNVTLQLPDVYDAVVGDTIQIFYKGIVNAVSPEMYFVSVSASAGNTYEKYYELTPTTAGNISVTFTLYGINKNVLDEKTVTFVVHSAPSASPATQKNVLCVGASLTQDGQWPAEMYRRLTGTDGTPAGNQLSNIKFIGTKTRNGAGYEGYGGWSFLSYNTENISASSKLITCTHDKVPSTDQHSIYRAGNGSQWKLETIESEQIKIINVSGVTAGFPATGTLTWVSGGTNHADIVYTASQNAPGNPFWDSTANKVDFSAYATRQGVSSIDYVYVLLGWNNASTSETTYKNLVQTFIDNVHASFPNAKIVLMGLEVPSRNGLGQNYTANDIYSKYGTLMQFVFNLDKWYDDIVANNENVYHINIAGQFDTEHNMPTATRTVNTRNSETETYQSNGVHPATPGYMQIADAAYRHITGIL